MNVFGFCYAKSRSCASRRSCFGDKLTNIANQEDRLLAFLHDGRITRDIHFEENRIRLLTLSATIELFAGHNEGARSWDRIGGLIETRKMIHAEPYAGLNATFRAIANGRPTAASTNC